MRIQNNNSNNNFKGIYKIPYSENTLKEIKTKVLPTYQMVSHQPATYFIGKNPFRASVDIVMETIAKKFNASVEWLKMNFINHGGEEKSLEKEVLYVVTGEKDITQMKEYIENRLTSLEQEIKEKTSFSHKIKSLFIKEEVEPAYPENTPEHLKFLFFLLKQDKIENLTFEESTQNVIKIKDSRDLFFKIMNER